jgi:hypothetical protein
MTAPIFKFKNVSARIDTTDPTVIYGVFVGTNGLDAGVLPTEVTAVLLTIQCANVEEEPVLITVQVSNGTTSRYLVRHYPVPGSNAFDPLTGNLVLAENDRLVVSASRASAVDVVVSLLEIANASAA